MCYIAIWTNSYVVMQQPWCGLHCFLQGNFGFWWSPWDKLTFVFFPIGKSQQWYRWHRSKLIWVDWPEMRMDIACPSAADPAPLLGPNPPTSCFCLPPPCPPPTLYPCHSLLVWLCPCSHWHMVGGEALVFLLVYNMNQRNMCFPRCVTLLG